MNNSIVTICRLLVLQQPRVARALAVSLLCYAGLAVGSTTAGNSESVPSLQSKTQQVLVENECQASSSASITGPHDYTANHLCEAMEQVATQGEVNISTGANVTFRSRNLVFGRQFQVFAGGRFSAQTLTGVNRYLTGRLFIGDDGHFLDLASGEFASLVPDDTDRIIYPSTDGKEFVEAVETYRRVPAEWWDNDAVLIRAMGTGLVVEKFELSESLIGAAKLSPDRNLVAAIWRDESSAEDYGDERLTVFSRSGQVLSRSPQKDVYSFDWLPDGRLVYTVGFSIYLGTHPNSAQGLPIKTFATSEGRPVSIAVSPDGNRIAFELTTDASPSPYVNYRNATVWLMNLDGSGLRLLATSNANTPRINTPAWSPDGTMLAAVEGHISGVSFVPDPIQSDIWWVTPIGGPPGALYAVPTDGEAIPLPADGASSAQPIFRAVDADSVTFVGPGIHSHMKWIGSAIETSVTAGSLPTDTGALNHGLTGTIYIDDDGVGDSTAVHGIDLGSGAGQLLFQLTDDDLDNVRDILYASADAQRFSLYYDDLQQGALYIFDGDGAILAGLALDGGTYDMKPKSPVRFSPVDSNLVLMHYRNLLSGSDDFGNYYVVVIDWSQGPFVKHFKSREYVAADWTPEGDIILAGKEGGIYRSTNAGGFADPALLFSFKEAARDLTVSPDGNHLAYYLAGQIWTSSLDGTSLRRLTAPAKGFHALPEWSPDGQYLAFKAVDNDGKSLDLGTLWVLAADAQNVRISQRDNTRDAIPLLDQSGEQIRIFGAFSWR